MVAINPHDEQHRGHQVSQHFGRFWGGLSAHFRTRITRIRWWETRSHGAEDIL